MQQGLEFCVSKSTNTASAKEYFVKIWTEVFNNEVILNYLVKVVVLMR